jgi:hypothetical protein
LPDISIFFVLTVPALSQVSAAAIGAIASIVAGELASAFEPYPNSQSILPSYPANKLMSIVTYVELNFQHHWGIKGV